MTNVVSPNDNSDKLLDGVQFNKRFGNRIFVKLLCEDEIHNGLKYITGLNKDPMPFNIDKDCSAGGIYFCSVIYI